jgi:two-component system, NarL family, invasion response regulator UvrY
LLITENGSEPRSAMIRILIADDHPLIRQGIHQIMAAETDIVIVAEAADGTSALALAQTVDHDLVLLDLSMPGTNGLEVLKQLKRQRPKVPVLILTIHEEHQFAVRALKSRASGYVMKHAAPEELVSAIRKVAAGGRYLSHSLAEDVADYLDGRSERPPHELLSDREYQVFRLIASGKTTRQIAEQLGLSMKTVATYRARIFEKMQMKTPAEVAAYVVRHKLGDVNFGG